MYTRFIILHADAIISLWIPIDSGKERTHCCLDWCVPLLLLLLSSHHFISHRMFFRFLIDTLHHLDRKHPVFFSHSCFSLPLHHSTAPDVFHAPCLHIQRLSFFPASLPLENALPGINWFSLSLSLSLLLSRGYGTAWTRMTPLFSLSTFKWLAFTLMKQCETNLMIWLFVQVKALRVIFNLHLAAPAITLASVLFVLMDSLFYP